MATPAEQAAAAAAAGYWIDQVTAGSADITASATSAILAVWGTYTAWYDDRLVAAQAAEAAETSRGAQAAAATLLAEYVGQVTADLRGLPRVEIPRLGSIKVRNGVDLGRVHARPAEVFRSTFAFTADDELATQRAIERAVALIEADAALAARHAQQEAMEQLRVDYYRRILRPELSQSGPCGLCVVASDQRYSSKELLPLHGRCKCITLPIVDDLDPGVRVNRADLKRIYAAAGDSTAGADLKTVRVTVNEHGELGPVLSVRGQKFTGPEDLATRRNPADNVRDLKKLLGVLDTLMDRSKSGEDLAAPLAYQHDRIARLRAAA